MSDVHTWSTTAASNNSASPNGFPENMAPSGVNDSAREIMAAIAKYRSDTDGVNTSTGSANAYVLAASRTMTAYAQGDRFCFKANFANTGAATLNVDSLGAKDIKRLDGSALVSGDIPADAIVDVVYDGTNFQLLPTLPRSEYLTSVSGTDTITASGAVSAYAAGQRFTFIPAATNTGATTININSIGAKNIYAFGAACVGGELVSGVPAEIVYDGTRFQIIGAFSPRLNFQHTAFLLVSSTTTNLSDATYTRINLVEQLDPGNNIPASNYYVAPANGNYFVFGSVAIAITNAIATTTQVAYERANNAGTNIGTGVMSASIMTVSSTPQVSGSSIVYMNAGDRLYLNGYQNNGGIRVAQAGNTCFLGGWRLT